MNYYIKKYGDNMEKIILTFKSDGRVISEIQGVRGNVCTKKTGWIEQLLGKVTKRTFKKEYFEHEVVKVSR